MPQLRLEKKYQTEYSTRSAQSGFADVVVTDSLGELARVFEFAIVEYRRADFSLAYRYVDESLISHAELRAMPTDLEKTSLDVCHKAADMASKVCWRRKQKQSINEGKGVVAKEFHSVGAYHLVHSSDKTAAEDVFLVGYALESVKLDDRKARLLTHYARSARDAAGSFPTGTADTDAGAKPEVEAKDDSCKAAAADTKGSGEPVDVAYNDADAKTTARSDEWDKDWEDYTHTARSDVSALSSSSSSWALFTPQYHAPPARPRPGASSNVPALAIARSASSVADTARSMYKDLVTVREFHSRLSARTIREDFEMGIDIESMINMEKVAEGSNAQIFSAIYRNKRVVVKVRVHVMGERACLDHPYSPYLTPPMCTVVVKAVFSDKADDQVVLDEFCFEVCFRPLPHTHTLTYAHTHAHTHTHTHAHTHAHTQRAAFSAREKKEHKTLTTQEDRHKGRQTR